MKNEGKDMEDRICGSCIFYKTDSYIDDGMCLLYHKEVKEHNIGCIDWEDDWVDEN